jgi:hypothetical protein
MSTATVTGFFALLEAEPTMMPEAPVEAKGILMWYRTTYETHHCLRCGDRATVALIVNFPVPLRHAGNRWLDLCSEHHAWIRGADDDRAVH